MVVRGIQPIRDDSRGSGGVTDDALDRGLQQRTDDPEEVDDAADQDDGKREVIALGPNSGGISGQTGGTDARGEAVDTDGDPGGSKTVVTTENDPSNETERTTTEVTEDVRKQTAGSGLSDQEANEASKVVSVTDEGTEVVDSGTGMSDESGGGSGGGSGDDAERTQLPLGIDRRVLIVGALVLFGVSLS